MTNVRSLNGLALTRRGFSLGAALGAAALGSPLFALVGRGGGTMAGEAEANAVLGAMREEFSIPAVSAAVCHEGDLLWEGAQGLANLEQQVPARPDHLFRLGSVSKVVTAAIGMRLVERGTVDLDAPISTYRPDLPEHHRGTSLRQLYNHQGGVRHYGANDLSPLAPGGSIDTRVFPTTEAALAIFIDDPLIAERGTTPNYSTFGYTLISAVLESASGTPFLDLILQEVAQPLGLATLAAEDALAIVPDRVGFYDPAAMYRALLPGVPLPEGDVVNSLPSAAAYKYAGGGMHAAAADVARLGSAQLAGPYLGDAARLTLFTPRTEASPRMPALSLGWRIDSHEQLGPRYHHAGNMQGCRAQIALYPQHGLSVAVMTNLGGTPGNILSFTDRIAAGFTAPAQA